MKGTENQVWLHEYFEINVRKTINYFTSKIVALINLIAVCKNKLKVLSR